MRAPTSAPLTEQTVFLARQVSERLTHQVLNYKFGTVLEITRRPDNSLLGASAGVQRAWSHTRSADQTLFTRAGEVDRLWQICQPVLDSPPNVASYARGSWGPQEALALAGPDGWRLPDE